MKIQNIIYLLVFSTAYTQISAKIFMHKNGNITVYFDTELGIYVSKIERDDGAWQYTAKTRGASLFIQATTNKRELFEQIESQYSFQQEKLI